MTDPRPIVVFGGSFDPPHMGHVLMAAYALAAHDLDRLLVIPTWQHPLEKRATATFEHRFEMCAIAMRHLSPVEISPIERELGGVSRTLRTLAKLHERHAGVPLRLLIGADLLEETRRWHRWDRVRELAPPLVVGRASYPQPSSCPIVIPDVSSTEVRARLAARGTTDGLLPCGVEAHIRAHRLYQGDPDA